MGEPGSDARSRTADPASDEAPAKGGAPSRRSTPRRWAFRIVGVFVIPALALVLMEGGLRAVGFGRSMSLVERRTIDGERRILSNQDFMARFFDPRIARDILPFNLPAKKEDGTFRVFVLGGSAAQGDPEPAFGVARLLETMLRHHYPTARFEVVNLAVAAINSHVVLPMAEACVSFEPDLFVVYLGNNEVVGPFGAGTVFSPMVPNRSLIRARVALASTRLGQLFARVGSALGGGGGRPEVWRELAMFVERQVRESDPRLDTVVAHYESNLRDIVRAGRRAGIPVVLCTVAVNLRDCAPFASLHREDLDADGAARFEAAYREGAGREAQGRYEEASAAFERALAIDDRHAETHYRLARCHLALERNEEAREHFRRARDLDALRFRADDRIHDAVRRVAQSSPNAHLVDCVRLFAQEAADGIPGDELFHEHVHLRFRGNHRIARAVVETVGRVASERLRAHRDATAVPLDEEACAERLAFTDWNRLEIQKGLVARMLQPPYSEQLEHEELLAWRRARIAELEASLDPDRLARIRETYERVLGGPDGHWSLRLLFANFLFGRLREHAAAEKQLRRVIRELPQHASIAGMLGQVLLGTGRLEEAEEQIRRSLAARERPSDRVLLSFALERQGRRDEAIAALEEAVARGPYSDSVNVRLAKLLLERAPGDPGALARCEELCREVLDRDPENGAARRGVAEVWIARSGSLVRAGRNAEARAALARALEADPDHPRAHFFLAGLLVQAGERQEAVRHLREVLHLEPEHAAARARLAELLRGGGGGGR